MIESLKSKWNALSVKKKTIAGVIHSNCNYCYYFLKEKLKCTEAKRTKKSLGGLLARGLGAC